ncbi:(+)-neomenthol dehydrogenase [Melia azedarach]|uniref:(+)-neomenthol dehydrogenase n=1 Tax=Melia azedarach TaxID=155640 RepID=A0ACC1YV03_MELAZ|nr:(+)-neomenthol dehydrogenase [Melia azedarach]
MGISSSVPSVSKTRLERGISSSVPSVIAIFRYAVVTGANKGTGFEICRQLASNGITVMLTARDDKRGLEAVEKLKQSGYDNVIFHQLDVADSASVESLADFVKSKFGKLDILVNNAGINGVVVDGGALSGFDKNVINEWAVGVLRDVENLTEEKVDEVLRKYLNDFKEGSPETKGWPASMSAYIMSKATMNAYTRILAKKYPNVVINCVCPGYVKTGLTYNSGALTTKKRCRKSCLLSIVAK